MALKGKTFGVVLGIVIAVGTLPAHALDTRSVVRDSRNNAVMNSFHNCVRTEWSSDRDICGANAAERAPVLQEVTRTTETMSLEARTVYFDFDKSDLTPEARNKLNTLAEALKSDAQVREARIYGYADRIGSDDYNDALSQRRATRVKDYLSRRGFVNSRVTKTRWFGETAPITRCPKEDISRSDLITCLSKDRRVEVGIEYKPIR